MMVGFGAGGGTDVATRIVAEPLGEVLGQRIVVENKPGAGGTIAGDIVAKGTKDGYNALMISTGHTVSAAMIKSQAYDAVKDFAPVGIIANSAIAIIVAKDFPANDLRASSGPPRASPSATITALIAPAEVPDRPSTSIRSSASNSSSTPR